MSFEILIDKKVDKFLKSLERGQRKEHDKIIRFLHTTLKNSDNPCGLANAKQLKGFDDNRYRWRLGDYRIIGKIENGAFKIIQIIRIAKRDERTYKDLSS